MAFERFLNHANALVLKYAMPFWGKPRWAALGVGIANEIQELENAIFDVIESRWLVNATGPRLRMIAKIVGQPILDYDDVTLKKLVGVRIAVNRSEGRWDDLLKILILWGASAFKLSPLYPAALRLDFSTPDPAIALLAKTIPSAVAAGVDLLVVSPVPGTSFPFLFSDSNSGVSNGNVAPSDANAAPTDRGLVSNLYT